MNLGKKRGIVKKKTGGENSGNFRLSILGSVTIYCVYLLWYGGKEHECGNDIVGRHQ